jgi:hypothetical protein
MDASQFPSPLAWRYRFCLGTAGLQFVGRQTIEFNRDVRPILSYRSFVCYGTGAAQRHPGLRCDLEGSAKEA